MALLTLNEDKDCSPDDGNEVKGQVHKISIVELGQPIRKKSQSTIPNKCLWSKFLKRRLENLSELRGVNCTGW